MINIAIIKNNSLYTSIEVKGHALYSNVGKDIVCAGISAIVFGTLNALSINEFKGSIDIDKISGKIVINNIDNKNKIQAIVETMHIQLKTIQKEYKEKIKIKEDYNELKI